LRSGALGNKDVRRLEVAVAVDDALRVGSIQRIDLDSQLKTT
jgi:hypothetical protein